MSQNTMKGVPIAFVSITQTRWDVLMQKLSPRETPIWFTKPGMSLAVVSHETYQALCENVRAARDAKKE